MRECEVKISPIDCVVCCNTKQENEIDDQEEREEDETVWESESESEREKEREREREKKKRERRHTSLSSIVPLQVVEWEDEVDSF